MNKKLSWAVFLSGMLVAATPIFAQSGDISGAAGEAITLGTVILQLVLALAVIALVGVVIWGAVTLGTNRPKGLAMVAGGLLGALICGLSYAFVAKLSGHAVPSMGYIQVNHAVFAALTVVPLGL